MRSSRLVLVMLISFLGASAASVAQAPVAVSPGSADGALIEDRCPTFSWGAVEGARSYQLVVYRLGKQGEEAQRVLRQSFAGAVSSWTPSLDRCLEGGGRYAWSVRAVRGGRASGWSAPSLFQVATGPSRVQFERALAVVRDYLGEQDGGGSEEPDGSDSGSRPESWRAGFDSPEAHPGVGSRQRTRGAPIRSTMANSPALSVEGTMKADKVWTGGIELFCTGLVLVHETGHCYELFRNEGGVMWPEAQLACERRGGYLATITSAAEQAHVESIMPASGAEQAWIGYSDARTEGVFQWTTGEAGITGQDAFYENWDTGQPDNDASGEDCTVLKGANKKWNDLDCGSLKPLYVCERDF